MAGSESQDSNSKKRDREAKLAGDDFALLILFIAATKPEDIPADLEVLKKASEVFHNPNHPDANLNYEDFSKKYLKPAQTEFKSSGLSLLDMIAKHESGGDYNIVYGGKRHDLTHMTIDQVQSLQKGLASSLGSSATGKYQIMGYTMKGLIQEMHLTGKELFDESMQDKMAVHLLKRRGYDKFLNNEISANQFVKNLSMEWASLPKDASGKSYYAGDKMGNKAFYSYDETFAAVQQTKQGGKGLENAEIKSVFASVNNPADLDATLNSKPGVSLKPT